MSLIGFPPDCILTGRQMSLGFHDQNWNLFSCRAVVYQDRNRKLKKYIFLFVMFWRLKISIKKGKDRNNFYCNEWQFHFLSFRFHVLILTAFFSRQAESVNDSNMMHTFTRRSCGIPLSSDTKDRRSTNQIEVRIAPVSNHLTIWKIVTNSLPIQWNPRIAAHS